MASNPDWLAERVYDPREADRVTYPLADDAGLRLAAAEICIMNRQRKQH